MYASVHEALQPIFQMFPDLLNIKNEEEETPLHVATLNGNRQMLDVLIGLGADGSMVDRRNLTALDIATWLKSNEMTKSLGTLKTSKLTVVGPDDPNRESHVPIYQWGQMLTSSLTLNYVSAPTSLLFNHVEHSPTTVKFGNNFAIMLTDTGHLYSWGLSSYGKLGHRSKKDLSIPTPISALKNKQIVAIACGKDHTLALDEIGIVHAWGNGSGGRLGVGNTEAGFIDTPTIIPFFGDKSVTAISCGQDFSMALCSGGQLYSWGKGTMGNLGYMGENGFDFQVTPKLVENLPPISQVSCGNWHTIVLSEEGEVYTFGSNKDGRLGVPIKTCASSSTPQLVKFDKKIKKIGAGSNFNAVLTDTSNFIYTWGCNANSQLGVLLEGHDKFTATPQLVQALLPYPVSSIEVGYEHVMVLTDNGEVITFGNNSNSQCGEGEAIKELCNFTKIRTPANSTVFKIAAGGNSSLISLTSGHSLFGTELASLLGDTSFADLRLTTSGSQSSTEYVECHRVIVASRVPKLHQLLMDEHKSPNAKNKINVTMTYSVQASTVDNITYIDFPNTSIESLRLLTKFNYTDHAHLSVSIVEELGMMATGLGLERLAYLCSIGRTRSLETMPSSSLIGDLNKLNDQSFAKHYYDVKFNIHEQGEEVATVVQSFKAMLCLRSPYFRMMLKGQFVETSMESIDMYEMSVDGFKSLLHYFYSNEVPIDPNNCVELVKLADFHQLGRAKELCAAVLRTYIDNDTLLNVYKFSLQYNLRVLTVLCESKIIKLPSDDIKVDTLPNFDELSEEVRQQVLKMVDGSSSRSSNNKTTTSTTTSSTTTTTTSTTSTSDNNNNNVDSRFRMGGRGDDVPTTTGDRKVPSVEYDIDDHSGVLREEEEERLNNNKKKKKKKSWWNLF
ncbi:hypothetical protein SAMD00019534_052440 [Acytostelium subglobosum LB1]|uniref:hypothetical protein n=1 Tax=Acytostelium subglobosum LB1 TaxID=1410327 RepID=UPI000644EC69|nr:hypothetical protein SAMD00019534_052440 [Acytostelium subglobosum LB1]GAM22069.1 hypothetical protein SAMD00019534_052440 [Acytostelium subglobosum LB1]|eukprot:XP_012755169.1 hypothetical protein SAMD00019534_052440 [Acytostelium subglobosum LB1]